MNKLIFPLIFLTSFSAYSGNEILSDQDLSKKLISTVKEIQVEQTLGASQEAQTCRSQNKFVPGSSNSDEIIQKTVDCFKNQILNVKGKNQNGQDALEALSQNLGLKDYGLVSTNDKKGITNYLADRMYKSLTGVDPKQKNLEAMIKSMKFGNKKLIDQQVFFELYSTQLVKNALYEISRYCFENFRIDKTPAREGISFIDYWSSGNALGALAQSGNNAAQYTDIGKKGFGGIDTTSNDTIYADLLNGMGANNADSLKKIQDFFNSCSSKIIPLCSDYEKDVATKKVKSSEEQLGRGANSCLTKAKLQAYRKAITDAGKIRDNFSQVDPNQLQIALDQSQYSFYDRGQSNPANSIDNLTNYTSTDLLNAKIVDDQPTKDKQDLCAKDPSGPGCEDFVVVDDSLEKVKFDLQVDMELKKEAEKARVKEIVKNQGQGLEEYLEANGYFDILNDYKQNKDLSSIEGKIDEIFEARKDAALAELQLKMGSRQMTEAEASVEGAKASNIQKNATEAKEERARLAQVVLFNNIITGSLELQKKNASGKNETIGKNIGALVKETSALKDANVKEDLFENLKATTDGQKGNTDNGSFAGAEILDGILGKK